MKAGTKQYFENVKKELINIKTHATKKEINNLNINSLDGHNTKECIYGQMTSDCHSPRAIELIRQCCKTKTSFESVTAEETQKVTPREEGGVYDIELSFSYLEHFICNFQEHNDMIVKFLKDEIKELNFFEKV